MKVKPVKVKICKNEKESWDTIWKWQWFMRDAWQHDFRKQEDMVVTRRIVQSLLPNRNVKSVLDCSCGLGRKTILLAEMGYDVEGSDSSAAAVRFARQFAKEQGVKIRFFQSCWEELGNKCNRKFDCVFSDAFDLIQTRKALKASAKGIYSVLKKGGKFIFPGVHQWFTEAERKRVIDNEWKRLQRFEVEPPYEKNGIRITKLYVHDRTPEGIFINSIAIIKEKGKMRVDIAKDTIIYFKWTWQDYVEVLRKVGFKKVYSMKVKGIPQRVPYIPNIAEK